MFEKLRNGKRYLFTREDKQYRANFINIIGDTIRLDNCDFCESPNTVICSPKNWIVRIDTLPDIMKDVECILPDDILLVIDEFV